MKGSIAVSRVLRQCILAAAVIAVHPWTAGASVTVTQTEEWFGPAASAWFGHSVGASGSTAIIGAPTATSGGSGGTAYLYNVATGNPISTLTATGSSNAFGWAVSISGNTALVGTNAGTTGPGGAYVFDATTGTQTFKLTPSDSATGNKFGSALSNDGSTALIGAPLASISGVATGSAYLFNTTTGSQSYELTPSDGASGDQFGFSTAIRGNEAIVGAEASRPGGLANQGSAYVFNASTGQQVQKLVASNEAAQDQFGYAVGIDGNLAVVGSPFADPNGITNSGAAYVFDVATGQQLFELTATDAAASAEFGIDVDVSGNLALIGSRDAQDGATAGAAYLFDLTTGTELAKILPGDGAATDLFAGSPETAVLDGSNIVVGAYQFNSANGSRSGAAYVFNVPEPTGAALLGGLMALASRRRRS